MLIANNDQDIQSTTKTMRENKYFQEFFTKYQQNIERSLSRLDKEAQSKKNVANEYYTCKTLYKHKIKDFISESNLYRKQTKNQIKGREDSVGLLLSAVSSSNHRKALVPNLLDIEIQDLDLQSARSKERQQASEGKSPRQFNLTISARQRASAVRNGGLNPLKQKLKVDLSRENQIKKESYGKWYLKPDQFGKKSSILNQRLENIKK